VKKTTKTNLSNKKAAAYEDPLTKLDKKLSKKLDYIQEVVINIEAIVEKLPGAPPVPVVEESAQPAEPTDPAAEASKPSNI
jgi:hypothetical protein